jgi:D,D-heptose 1,7-bisphosphate phosphatase
VIVCGGSGSRLTKGGIFTPKSLLKIGSETLIFTQIHNFYKYGICNFYFSLGNGAAEIESHLDVIRPQFPGANFYYFRDDKISGTAGSILTNLNSLPEKFFVLYGDIYVNIDISEMVKSIDFNFDFIFVYRPTDHPFDSNLLKIDAHGKVLKISGKGEFNQEIDSRKASVGLMICHKSVYKNSLEDESNHIDIEKDIVGKNFNQLSVFAIKLRGYARDVGTMQRLKRTTTDVRLGLDTLKKKGIVFLDRDGTLNKDIGFFSKSKDFEFLPGTIQAIKLLNLSSYFTVVVTNQSAIARNISTYQEVLDIHDHVNYELSKWDAYIDNFYFCPHHPDTGFAEENPFFKKVCSCRKPSPGMLINAMLDYEVGSEFCWLVGDSKRDIEAAKMAKIKSVLVPRNQDLSTSLMDFDFCDFKTLDLLSGVQRILNDNF